MVKSARLVFLHSGGVGKFTIAKTKFSWYVRLFSIVHLVLPSVPMLLGTSLGQISFLAVLTVRALMEPAPLEVEQAGSAWSHLQWVRGRL